jgi:hypothetical protein
MIAMNAKPWWPSRDIGLAVLIVWIATALVVSSIAKGQEVTLPAEIRGSPGAWLIVAPESVIGGKPRWRIDPGLQEVRLDLLLPPEQIAQLRGKVLTSTVAGRYKIEAWNALGDVASEIATCIVVIGNAPPVPIPPIPVPPDPTPTPPPVVSGARGIAIIRETADTTPAVARLVTALRVGPHSQYLASKKHTLQVLDDDSVSGDGRASAAVEAWRPIFAGMKLPVLIIYDPVSRSVLSKEPLPTTAEAVVEAIKKTGG